LHSPVEKAPRTGWPAKADHYRPDIDGLRAWAVLSVVIFHAFPRAVQGGFVGVDVFFVISGFLITSIIIEGLDRRTFSFREFYSRRIKRIFPALILVLSASLVLGWFVLLPDEYRQLGKHVTAGAGFISNLIFWREAGYFDAAADTKILLHLWSLGIEEQYYLIWPALVWAAWQKRLNLLTLFVAIWLVSFYSNVHEVRFNATAAFYSPLSRFWELMAGSLLAYLVRARWEILAEQEARISSWIRHIVFQPGYGNPETGLREASALTGAALLAFSMFAISQQKLFPGWWALLPTAGAYLIIFAGPKAWFNRAILSNRILVWFGLISYPLYLWHWPLLAFARNTFGDTPSPQIRIAFVAVGIGLAWLTYRLVEIPIRFHSRKPVTIFVLGCLMIGIAGFGYYDFANNGLGFRVKDRNEYAAYFEGYLYDASKHVVERTEIAQNQCNFYRWDNSPGPPNGPRDSIDPSCYTKHSQKSVLILGDSNAADLYYGLKEVLPKDISTLLIFSSGCAVRPIVEADLQADHCNMANYFALNQIKEGSSRYRADVFEQFVQHRLYPAGCSRDERLRRQARLCSGTAAALEALSLQGHHQELLVFHTEIHPWSPGYRTSRAWRCVQIETDAVGALRIHRSTRRFL
jgi:peptidoglycan/LPS O-acetylase OafA/YrhL